MKRVALCLFLCPALCAAQETNRAVVAVQARSCDPSACMQVRGSGVAIGTRQDTGNVLVLTAAHVVRNTSDVRAYVGNQWRRGTVRTITRQDGNWDLALVEVEYREPWPVVQLARDVLGVERSEVSVAGYAGGLRWVHRRGLLGRHTDKYWVSWNGAPPVEGQSGGAVIVGGQLAGVISGYQTDGSGTGVAQNAGAIRVFLGQCGVSIDYGATEPQATPVPATIPNPAVGPKPSDTIPNPAKGPDSASAKELAALQKELAAVKEQLKAVQERPITVELRDPITKQVKSRAFAPGEPIRLQLPTVEAQP